MVHKKPTITEPGYHSISPSFTINKTSQNTYDYFPIAEVLSSKTLLLDLSTKVYSFLSTFTVTSSSAQSYRVQDDDQQRNVSSYLWDEA